MAESTLDRASRTRPRSGVETALAHSQRQLLGAAHPDFIDLRPNIPPVPHTLIPTAPSHPMDIRPRRSYAVMHVTNTGQQLMEQPRRLLHGLSEQPAGFVGRCITAHTYHLDT